MKREPSVFDGMASELPELQRAIELQQRAAQVGFDWHDLPPVLAKVREELLELEAELDAAGPWERRQDELGDLLFAVANLARKLGIDPERALRSTNRKFQLRFGQVETGLAQLGKRPEEVTLEVMDALWEQAKRDAR